MTTLTSIIKPSISMFLCLLFILSGVHSQSKNDNEIIAEGSAKMKVRPDLATFILTVEKRDSVEKTAIKLLNIEVGELVKSLYKIGFTDKVIKISDYDISSSRDEDGKKNYTASNILNLEFYLDTKMIDAFYRQIQDAALKDLDISFDTKVSDSLEKVTRTKLVQYAIEDAKSNAGNIAKALNIKLAKVKHVSKYREGGLRPPPEVSYIKFTAPEIVEDNAITYVSSFDKFQVEEVELDEKITIVFQITQ